MDKTLHRIKQRIGDIQSGLLRFGSDTKKMTFPIRLSAQEGDILKCDINEQEENDQSLANKKVTLIQKSDNDYLYISGVVDKNQPSVGKALSVKIMKACWFIRKSKGSVTWLQEKYHYEYLVNKQSA